jgi:hypothetical protein
LEPAESDVLGGVAAITVGTSHTCALMKQKPRGSVLGPQRFGPARQRHGPRALHVPAIRRPTERRTELPLRVVNLRRHIDGA